ncbi:MAG TPA: PH domain-containing protein, partial [Solirubrobacteraceae bacterium]|nr:PH domain-containing protein [Solirubrobacteraceae bacterium]
MSATPPETVIYSGHPSWRSMLDFHLAGVVLAGVAGVIGKLAAGWGIAVAAFAAVLAVSLAVGAVRRAATHYTISDRRLYIRRGILRRSEQHTTIDRVQNVETSQSILERILRIGTVDFDTAATDDSVFAFTGVASPRRVVAAVDQAQDARRRADQAQ